LRVFLAVPPDPEWSDGARALSDRLRAVLPRAAWTRPESWHLTLAFLGEIASEAAEQFAARMEETFTEAAGGELAAAGAITFPPRGRPRVAGIGFRPGAMADELERLAGAGAAAARALGLPASGRDFHPHVTLARIRDPWPRAAVDAFRREADAWRFPTWRVRACVLYRSRLDPGGAVHSPLREWALPAPAEIRA
jgi:2'-5' RNA ligase